MENLLESETFKPIMFQTQFQYGCNGFISALNTLITHWQLRKILKFFLMGNLFNFFCPFQWIMNLNTRHHLIMQISRPCSKNKSP